ncbi:DUF4148 domain-containing protein [Actimicrobium antarcticum]|uniref:Uncharacterized protein n=1 Tax=Actimicrobium antarcticum TaxID=1051899 RepID=A0ABP7TB24_9BURK
MKKALLLLALVQGITLSAFAQTAAPADAAKTRTEVKTEAKAANMAGELNKGGNVGVTAPAASTTSTKARADVKAEAKAAVKSGDMKSSEIAAPAKAMPVAAEDKKTRAEVKAEAKAANKAGELTDGNIGKQPAPVVKKARAKKPAKAAMPAAAEAAK